MTGGHSPGGSTRGVVFDDILDAIAHIQRRKLLIELLDYNSLNAVSVRNDRDESADEEGIRLVKMRHVHLPKLEAYGFINWDRETNEVSKGPHFEEIRPLLDFLQNHRGELPASCI